MDTFKTVLQNIKGALTGWPENVRQYFNLMKEFEPQVVEFFLHKLDIETNIT